MPFRIHILAVGACEVAHVTNFTKSNNCQFNFVVP